MERAAINSLQKGSCALLHASDASCTLQVTFFSEDIPWQELKQLFFLNVAVKIGPQHHVVWGAVNRDQNVP
jgi:hypothetical protein